MEEYLKKLNICMNLENNSETTEECKSDRYIKLLHTLNEFEQLIYDNKFTVDLIK
jgi:hypothetical protein